MKYIVLTTTTFFKEIQKSNYSESKLESTYADFIQYIYELCSNTDYYNLFFILHHTEIELECLHRKVNAISEHQELVSYIHKAMTFTKKILHQLECRNPLFFATNNHQDAPSPYQWTGTSVELVEMVYALCESGCINGGNITLKDVFSRFEKIFSIDIKESSSLYSSIKRRKSKSDSRTYFLDLLTKNLNKRLIREESN